MVAGSPFSLSWQDYYDYGRCPRIVSINSYLWKHPLPRKARKRTPVPAEALTPQEIGMVGEKGVEKALSDDDSLIFEEDLADEVAKVALPRIRLSARQTAQQLIREISENLVEVREQIRGQLPGLKIVGKGTVRFGFQVGVSKPDFVAITRSGARVFIETKTTQAKDPKNEFQAKWYNSVSRRNCPSVLESYQEGDRSSVVPRINDGPVERTVLVYTRTAEAQVITDWIPIADTHENVWLAKQLGLDGKAPRTDCDGDCPHHALERKLPRKLREGNLEPHTPMPILSAQNWIDSAGNLDLYYQWHRFQRAFNEEWDEIRTNYIHNTPAWRRFADTVRTDWGIDEVEIGRLLAIRGRDMDEVKPLSGALKDEFDWWKKALGEEKARRAEGTAMRRASEVYPMPARSKRFLTTSRAPWGS